MKVKYRNNFYIENLRKGKHICSEKVMWQMEVALLRTLSICIRASVSMKAMSNFNGKDIKLKNVRAYYVDKKAAVLTVEDMNTYMDGIIWCQDDCGNKTIFSTQEENNQCRIISIKYPKENNRYEFYRVENAKWISLKNCIIYFADENRNMLTLFDESLQEDKAGHIFDQPLCWDDFLRSYTHLFAKQKDEMFYQILLKMECRMKSNEYYDMEIMDFCNKAAEDYLYYDCRKEDGLWKETKTWEL